MKDNMIKGLSFVMAILVICIFIALHIGVCSLFVGALLYISDYLIGTELFKWNIILFGGILIVFIKTVILNRGRE